MRAVRRPRRLLGKRGAITGGGQPRPSGPAEQAERIGRRGAAAGGASRTRAGRTGGRPIGTPLTAGDLERTVTGATQATELVSQVGEFGTNKTGNFVIVDFVVTNNGSEAVYVPSGSLVLLDNRGREFQTDTDAFEYVDPSKNILIEQIDPGVSGEGQVIFSVAPDASGFTLRLGDASLFGTETGLVNLGF